MVSLTKIRRDENGVAALLVVGILVILLSLVSIGFSRLINRDLNQSLESQKGKIASYAAESGINQITGYLNHGESLKDQSSCNGGLLDRLNSSTLSGDKNTEYTCVLLNQSPNSLSYSGLGAQSSQLVKVQPGAAMSSFFVSWQLSGRAGSFAPAGITKLPAESTWGDRLPLLKLSLYSSPGGGSLDPDQGFSASTYYLYPANGGTSTVSLTGGKATADATLVDIDCPNQSLSLYQWQGKNTCSVVINNLPNASDPNATYFLQLTPIYARADITIQGQRADGASLKFPNTQAIIDVTAKSNNVVKRLQARVRLSASNEASGSSEFSLRSGGTLCKRYVVPAGGLPFIDPGSIANCAPPGSDKHTHPPVPVTQPATDISPSTVTLNGTVQPFDTSAKFFFQYAPGATQKNQPLTDTPPQPGDEVNITNGTTTPYWVFHVEALDLSSGKPYHFRVCATNTSTTKPVCGSFLPFAYKPPKNGTLSVVTGQTNISVLNQTGGPQGCGSGAQTNVFTGYIYPNGNKTITFWWEEYYQNNLLNQPPTPIKAFPVPGAPLNETRGAGRGTYYYEQCPIPTNVFSISFGYYYRFCAQGEVDGKVCGQWEPPPPSYKQGGVSMLSLINKLQKSRRQDGVASIIVVGILVVLIGLISIGFSHLVNRDVNREIEDQKAKTALYAAESGINATISYLKTHPSATASGCQSNPALVSYISNGVSTASFPCVTVNNNPTTLSYSAQSPMKSKVVKLSSSSAMSNFYFYWALTPNKQCGAMANFFNSGQNFSDENTWINGCYAPLIRMTIYSIPASGCSSVANLTSCAGYSSRTIYLYPGSLSNVSAINQIDYSNAAIDGSIQTIQCGGTTPPNSYSRPPVSSYCNAVINNLPSAGGTNYNYYAKVTPLYGQADFGFEAQNVGGSFVSFQNTQTVIDVTAASNGVLKRLQAHVDMSGLAGGSEIDNLPEFGLASAGTLCKRYQISSGTVSVSTTNTTDCSSSGGNQPPPPQKSGPPAVSITPVIGSYSNGSLYQGQVTPNDTSATYYFDIAKYSAISGYSIVLSYHTPPGIGVNIYAGPYRTYTVGSFVPLSIANLTPNQQYGARMCVVNSSRSQAYCSSYLRFTYVPNTSGPAYNGPSDPGSSGGGGGSGGNGNPPPGPNITCHVDSVSVQGNGASSANASATGACDGDPGTSTWQWTTSYTVCTGANGGSSGNSTTVTEYANSPGTITFTINSSDGSKSANKSGSIPSGNFTCP